MYLQSRVVTTVHMLAGLAASLAITGVRAETVGCLMTPSEVAEIGSAAIGVVDKVHVKRGDTVRAGQVVVSLRADVERANLDSATGRAAAEAELNAAIRAQELADRKLARTNDLHRQQFVSAQAVDQAVADAQVAQGRVEAAREQSAQARRELAVARAQLDVRVLRSPITGIVVDIYRHPGERIEDKPILKVATVQPLNVEVVLPASMYQRLRVGQSATVQPGLPGLPAVEATVRLIDKVLDPASNTLRARLEVANADGAIPAGLRCKLALSDGPGGPAKAADAASAGMAEAPVRLPSSTTVVVIPDARKIARTE